MTEVGPDRGSGRQDDDGPPTETGSPGVDAGVVGARVVEASAAETEVAEAPDEPAIPRSGRRRRGLGCLIEIVETVVLTVALFLGIHTFLGQPYQVQGASMESTLSSDEYVIVDKLTPRWSPYVRGDIVVLTPPEGAEQGPAGTPFIKRVIGVEGDRIELRDGLVYLNGSALDEPYVYVQDGVRDRTNPTGDVTSWLVPPGHLFVLGDHRRASADSRLFGPIEISHVIGRAWLRYWPVEAFGPLPTAGYGTPSASP